MVAFTYTSIKFNISLSNYASRNSARLACGLDQPYYGIDLVDCYSHAVDTGVVFG
jgi:hypothetical protein